MGTIDQLLAQLDLNKFAPKFREEDIDLAAAAKLSEDDLKELGLTLGARKKLYDALHPPAKGAVAAARAAATPSPAQGDDGPPITGVWRDPLLAPISMCSRMDPPAVQGELPAA